MAREAYQREIERWDEGRRDGDGQFPAPWHDKFRALMTEDADDKNEDTKKHALARAQGFM